MDSLDLDALLPPRKRLLAGLKKKNSSDCGLPLPIPSISTELYARLHKILNSSSSPIEHIIKEVNLVASDAAEAAAAARVNAMEKAEAAAKAKVSAKSALELVGLIRESDDRQLGSSSAKSKLKKRRIEIKRLYDDDGLVETDEELALRLQRAMNGSPRISKKSDKRNDISRKLGGGDGFEGKKKDSSEIVVGKKAKVKLKPPLDTGVRQSLSSKYGALPEEVGPLLLAARSMNLAVVGVCFHVGTAATAYETFEAAIKSARGAFDLARNRYGFKMHVLDIGGGFVAGGLFEEAGMVIEASIGAHFGDWAGELRVVAEPGRYFAETAATLATCVIGKRVRGGIREYWINDGIYGSLGCIERDPVNVSLLPIKKAHHGTRSYTSTVFGPTCDSLDVVGRELRLPEMEVGDWIVSPNMGAYTKALGSDFNGFSTSAIPVYLANSRITPHEDPANEVFPCRCDM